MKSIVDQARAVAVRAHGEQMYGNEPYVVHLDEVAALCEPYGELVQVIGYLHDTLEDTDLTKNEIEVIFGSLVADCVEAMSDPEAPSRKLRKQLAHARLAQIQAKDRLAPTLQGKAADRVANIRRCVRDNSSMLEMYRKEHGAFRAAVYRPGVNDDLIREIDALLAWPGYGGT